MKMIGILFPAALVGAVIGARFGGPIAANILPDAGTHGAWYASRASGVTAYLLLWLSLVGGLWMSSAWMDGLINRGRLLAIHQTAGIAGIVLGLVHGLVLVFDSWTHFTLRDVLVPFGSYYRTLPTAFGQAALYLSAVVSFSFWFRSRIGTRAWKYLHYTAFAAYGGALWHGLIMGTDARTPWLLGTYLATSLAVVFSIVVRVTYRRPVTKRKVTAAAQERTAA